MNYLGNAFSLQMLMDGMATAFIAKIDKENIPVDCISVIGHADLAEYLGVPMNRATLKLGRKDTLYVAQFVGGRLPEGYTILHADQMGMIEYYRVCLEYTAIDYLSMDMLENPENYGLI